MPAEKSILITGKQGQVGFELARALAPLGNCVAVDQPECDLADPDAIHALLEATRPDIIVNPAAYTAVDKAESEQTLVYAINARAPAILAEWATRNNAFLVHYSTDYVFDGVKPAPYNEMDNPNPLGVYGASKLAGEDAITRSGARHLILRTSWVVGAHGGNFAKKILQLAREREELRIVADQQGVPTSAALIADITALLLRDAIRTPDTFPHGLYHLAAGGETNWHAYARHVVEYALAAGHALRASPNNIHAIATTDYPTPAQRPLNSRLCTRKLKETFDLTLPDWRDGLDHILAQLLPTS